MPALDHFHFLPFLGLVRTLIVGCGYVGTAVGRWLVGQGHEVFGLRRSLEECGQLHQAGITPLAGDISRASTLAPLPPGFEWVVNTGSSSSTGTQGYREVYLCGTGNLRTWLKSQPPKDRSAPAGAALADSIGQ